MCDEMRDFYDCVCVNKGRFMQAILGIMDFYAHKYVCA